MTLVKYAALEEILEIKTSRERLPYTGDTTPGAQFAKFASIDSEPINGEDGYLYVRARAISSRVNKNNDGWPAAELEKAYRTFIGRPIFVDHNNSDPRRTRGVIVDARLHKEDDEKTAALDPYYATAPDNHKPPTWIEILMEIDAATFPKLADAIEKGEMDATSMGANIERSICSVCGNEAVAPSDYCAHINAKGVEFEITADNGEKIKKKSYEDCYGITFFEDSWVFDPADETALKISKTAAPFDIEEQEPSDRTLNYEPQSEMITAPQQVDTLRREIPCPNCHSDVLTPGPDGVLQCDSCQYEQPPEGLDNPDLSQAQHRDDVQQEEENAAADDDEVLDKIKFNDKPKAQQQQPVAPVQPVSPVGASINRAVATEVISEMKWNTVLETNDKVAVAALIKGAATEQTQIDFRGGIHFGTHAAFNQAGIQAQVTYPTGETLPIPGNPMQHMKQQDISAKEMGTNNWGDIPITVTAPDDQIAQAIQLIHDGGMARRGPEGPVASNRPKNKKIIAVPSKRSGDAPSGAKVVKDSLKPVESGNLVTIDGVTYELVLADRRTIKREEREGEDGVTRVEEIVEETGSLPGADTQDKVPEEEDKKEEEEPEDKEEKEEAATKESLPVAASITDEQKLMLALALADDLVEHGALDKADKLSMVAHFEKRGVDYILARREQFEMDKQRLQVRKQVRSSSSGLPRFASVPRTIEVTDTDNTGFIVEDLFL